MSNRSANFFAAIFASILMGTSFAAVAENGAKETGTSKETGIKTADSCLLGPKGPLPAGGHWYYRIDRATKRNCWYIGEDKNKSARATPKDSINSASDPASPVAADPVSPQQTINVRKSIADARAELTAPQARVEDLIEPQTTGAVPVASIANGPRAVAPDTSLSSTPITSRWPESAGVSPSSGPRLAASEPPQSSQAQNSQTQSPPTNATPAREPAVTPVAMTAADSLQAKQSASMQMLLLTMAGALALAGITASLVFRFGRARLMQPEARNDRRAIWDSVHTERNSPSMFPDEDTPIWRRDASRNAARNLPRDPRAPDDPERRVTEMLARLARSAQT
ncbi:MAG: hypothetical protein ACREEK_29095 [Bradyrhizobium sp.]